MIISSPKLLTKIAQCVLHLAKDAPVSDAHGKKNVSNSCGGGCNYFKGARPS